LIDGWLQDARAAYNEGRLADARKLLRLAANESDDAAHGLNAAIAEANIKIAEGA
jgi:hypothetical protein